MTTRLPLPRNVTPPSLGALGLDRRWELRGRMRRAPLPRCHRSSELPRLLHLEATRGVRSSCRTRRSALPTTEAPRAVGGRIASAPWQSGTRRRVVAWLRRYPPSSPPPESSRAHPVRLLDGPPGSSFAVRLRLRVALCPPLLDGLVLKARDARAAFRVGGAVRVRRVHKTHCTRTKLRLHSRSTWLIHSQSRRVN